jgi:enoyl-CoA hydratase/carnithine racemase
MLTPNYITQVKRGVESMYIDHSVELIYLTTAKAEHFSNGTDFRTIMHYKANNEKEKAAAYLGQVFDLQATFAKINKPLMTVAPGNSLNSGAGLVAASGLPYICYGSMLAFNEVQFGFVPHAGSCYYASRLPGDIGTFLTLTGFPISG